VIDLPTKRILVLGGTSEAFKLAETFQDQRRFSVIYSLAGRLENPRVPNCEIRTGGFGGVEGLSEYVTNHRIDAIVDATHPFAARISHNVEQASKQTGIPLLALVRPSWSPIAGDVWHEVPDIKGAAEIIQGLGKRILLTIGRQEASAFAECTDEYFLIRAIEKPDEPLPPNSHTLLARGPFQLEEERSLLRSHAIDLIVSKNSGGDAAYPKLQAARELRIPVVMVRRPRATQAPCVATISDAIAWLEDLI
jgi:precorrin-6A/cobalt-precorrin-6A reductase